MNSGNELGKCSPMKDSTENSKLRSAKSLLLAYAAKVKATKKTDNGEKNRRSNSLSPVIRTIVILAIYDGKSAKWVCELLVDHGVIPNETDPKKRANQTRKVCGWISKIRVEDMKLPPLCKGLDQPPDMAEARKRWDAINPRPRDEDLLNGKWTGIAGDYSDLNLSPPKRKKVMEVVRTRTAKATTTASPRNKEAILRSRVPAPNHLPPDIVKILGEAPDWEDLPFGKNQIDFDSMVEPIFERREDFLKEAKKACQTIPLINFADIFQSHVDLLPRNVIDEFVTGYADLYVIFRSDTVLSSRWRDGLFEGKDEFESN